jgi:hypothetical protein
MLGDSGVREGRAGDAGISHEVFSSTRISTQGGMKSARL